MLVKIKLYEKLEKLNMLLTSNLNLHQRSLECLGENLFDNIR